MALRERPLDWAVPMLAAVLAHGAVLLRLPADMAACCLVPDSATYLWYFAEPENQLTRTPGYPAFLWLLRSGLGLSLPAVLGVQVALVAATAAATSLLSRAAFPDLRGAGLWAGLGVALSFTGITLSHQVLSEILATAVLVAGLLCLRRGTADGRAAFVWLAGAAFALAALIKPVFGFLGVALPLLAWLLRGERLRPGVVVGATVLALSAPLGLSAWNQARHGFFAPSLIGVATAAEYLASQTLAMVHASGPDTLLQETAQARAAVRELAGKTPDARARSAFYTRTVRTVLGQYPALAWRIAASNARANAPRPFAPSELHKSVRLRPPAWTGWLNTLLYALALAGAVRAWRLGQGRFVLALMVPFVCLWLLTAITFGQGGRIMYPMEFAVFVLAGAALARRRDA